MKLDPEFYDRLKTFNWFDNCGSSGLGSFSFEIRWLATNEKALTSLNSNLWADARTEAQGDLTGYLAKHHYSSYAGYWNNLSKESRSRLEKDLMPNIRAKLRIHDLDSANELVLLDLNRAALQAAYQKRFPNVPGFFRNLLDIYESGHLPCGWDGHLAHWPSGTIVAF